MLQLVVAAILLTLINGATAEEGVLMIDAHSQIAQGVDMDRVLSLVNEAGVSRTILSGRGGSGREVIAAARLHPGRITPSINMKYQPQALLDRVDDAVDRIRLAGAAPVFGAISEAMVCHEQKGRRAPEILRDFNAPEIREALAVAEQRHWPFVIHIEFRYARSIGRYEQYMRDLEGLLALHPLQPMALTHMGQLEPDEVRQLIDAHPNIYFLTSHSNPVFIEARRAKYPWTNLFAASVLAPAWRDLFIRHPQRFVLAFDNVYSDDWGDLYLRQVRLWRSALADLPSEIANAVAHRNAEHLWRLSPTAVPDHSPGLGARTSANTPACKLPLLCD